MIYSKNSRFTFKLNEKSILDEKPIFLIQQVLLSVCSKTKQNYIICSHQKTDNFFSVSFYGYHWSIV